MDRIEEKTNKLREIFDSIVPGTNVADNQTVQELLSIVKTSQPKITKWIEENAGEDSSKGRLDRLLHLNDVMNEILEKYESLKRHQSSSSSGNPPQSGRSRSKSPEKKLKSNVETSLIDLDGDWDTVSSSKPYRDWETTVTCLVK